MGATDMGKPSQLAYIAKQIAFRDIDEDNKRENERLGLKEPFKRVNCLLREKDICDFYGIRRDFRKFNGGHNKKEK